MTIFEFLLQTKIKIGSLEASGFGAIVICTAVAGTLVTLGVKFGGTP